MLVIVLYEQSGYMFRWSNINQQSNQNVCARVSVYITNLR